MSDIVFKYLNDIIPHELSDEMTRAELLNKMIVTGLGNKMMLYSQRLRNAIEKRGRIGSQCKVNINWRPKKTPQQLSCIWDKFILGSIPKSKFGLYINIYGGYLVRRKSYYIKMNKGLSARP